jgi:hypothetical protein
METKMTIHDRSAQKRTIVLFTAAMAVALLATGCAGLPQTLARQTDCPPARTLLCEEFGPESRCHCADTATVSRSLAGLGVGLQNDFRRW